MEDGPAKGRNVAEGRRGAAPRAEQRGGLTGSATREAEGRQAVPRSQGRGGTAPRRGPAGNGLAEVRNLVEGRAGG